MKRRIRTLLLLLVTVASAAIAQKDYSVPLSSPLAPSVDEETNFITTYFPMKQLCKWTPGIKFMFIPDSGDEFIPIFYCYENGKEVVNDLLKNKTVEYVGSEETEHETYIGKIYTSRFIFECEGKKYYYEMKDTKLNDLCDKDPRAGINGLVYLQDINTAKELLIGKTLYTRTTIVKVDDVSSYSGYREDSIPKGEPVKVMAISIGSKAFPVRIVFTDSKGNTYYIDVAMSRTNSRMEPEDFQAEKRMSYFPNAFSFTNPDIKAKESIQSKYIGQAVYPLKTIRTKQADLLRYTPLQIKDVQPEKTGTSATLLLADVLGTTYRIKVDLRYDPILRNEDFIENLFEFANIRKKYPNISEANWLMLAKGEVKPGMTTEECKLAIGEPIEIRARTDSRFETWLYRGKILEFENGILLRAK